jgi:diaminopimelate decarboxylase
VSTPFHYEQDSLYCDGVCLADIAARCGTPVYVYSAAAILERYRDYDEAFAGEPHRVCYAVKANSNLAVLSLLAKAGAGFDIVSGGELFRVLKAGGDPSGVVYSGVGKTRAEIEYAIEAGVHRFNCESEAELGLLDALAARRRVTARASLRVNPDVNAVTHPYISTGLRDHKFGINIEQVEALYDSARAFRNIALDGVSCHIGSQILDTSALLEGVDRSLELVRRLREAGHVITEIDFGGGLGVAYKPGESTPSIREFVCAVRQRVSGQGLTVAFEPGRSIVAEAGALVARVLYRKHSGTKEFAIVDAAMTDLIRPALYRAHHEILPVRKNARPHVTADVVGPVCETGDFLARHREIADVLPGDLVAVATAGAYGFVSASNYNSRPRPAEVLVEGGAFRVVRQRETLDDMLRGESL